jgi:hypothetical protein
MNGALMHFANATEEAIDGINFLPATSEWKDYDLTKSLEKKVLHRR